MRSQAMPCDANSPGADRRRLARSVWRPGLACSESPSDVRINLRELPLYLTPAAASAALVGVLLAFAGPTFLVLQAAENANLSTAELNSWLFGIFVGGGVASVVLALVYRQPICGAASIAGVAMLVSSLARHSLPEAVGAYLVSGLLILLLAMSGLFAWVMERIPPEIVMGMLAGVLLRFAAGIFTPIVHEPVLVSAMLAVFVVVQKMGWRTPTLAALFTGMALAAATGYFRPDQASLQLSGPLIIAPVFSIEAVLSLSLPLTLLALTSQNAAGIGILWSQGYAAPTNAITLVSGLGSLVTALFGSHGVSMAAPLTAICSSPATHPDPRGRYAAAVATGLLMIACGLCAATVTPIFMALPAAVIAVVAGLSMMPVIIQALRRSVGQDTRTYGAFFALVIAASDVTILGLAAPFWALLAGLSMSQLLDCSRQSVPQNVASPKPAAL